MTVLCKQTLETVRERLEMVSTWHRGPNKTGPRDILEYRADMLESLDSLLEREES